MASHRRRTTASRINAHGIQRWLSAAAAGAIGAGTLTDLASITPPSTSRPPTIATLSAIAPYPDAERHAPDDEGSEAAWLIRRESHDVPPVDNLAKATAIADRAAAYAATLRAARAGGAPDVALYGGRAYASPTVGRLTSAAGPRWGTRHEGADIANQIGTPIYAVTDGVVIDSGPAYGFGLWVRIRHSNGWTSVYGHIDRALVSVGQRVNAGERIAAMGNRGQSTGPHLHIEVWDKNGSKVDPMAWLAARGIEATRRTETSA